MIAVIFRVRDYGLLERLQAPQSRRVVTDPNDLAYVQKNFRAIEDLDPQLPAPCYHDASGTAYVPHDYEDQERDRDRFRVRACAEINRLGLAYDDAWIDDALVGYVDGVYGICLKSATPENIVRKNGLIDRIARLIEAPRRTEALWLFELRESVDALDRLERTFCAFDRTYFGRPVSRDTSIDAVRKNFPELLTDAPPKSTDPRPSLQTQSYRPR